ALVEAAMLDPPLLSADMAILDVDLRGLRETRELLVGRLGGNDARRLRPEIGKSHGEASGIEWMELHESGPGLVEQDVVAEMADTLQDHLGAIDRAVVGALLDHRDPEGARFAPSFRILD